MKLSWFSDYMAQALPQGLQKHPLLDDCARAGLAIAKVNGGEAVLDTDLDEGSRRQFALARFEESLARRVRRQTDSLFTSRPVEFYFDSADGGNEYIRLAALQVKVDVNTAGQKDLEDLPGIGKTLAGRILARRQQAGPFADKRELLAIQGMTEAHFEKFKHMVTVRTLPSAGIVTPELARLSKSPSLRRLIELLERSGASFTSAQGEETPLMERLLAELQELHQEVSGDPLPAAAILPGTRASAIRQALTREHQVAAIEQGAFSDNVVGGLLFDSQYVSFLKEAFDRAKKSIEIAMFYLRLGEDQHYPTRALIDRLVAAQERGLAVRVVLDKDREGDVYASRVINKPAYDYLNEKGITVKFDAEDVLLHSKLVVVDSELTVIGSHNWTAGSFYRYDDVSLFVISKELGNHYSAWFGAQF